MRRGLMGWDEAELPRSVLEARLKQLQDAMARQGLEALILYTNLVRPAAVCWLTGFTPYWIESLLLVPVNGRPMLATALSKRVAYTHGVWHLFVIGGSVCHYFAVMKSLF